MVAGFAWLLVAQDATPPGFRAYRMQHVDASEVTSQLDKMLSELNVQHEIVVDRTSNRVLVHGSEETQRLAVQLIETLDHPPTGAVVTEKPRSPVLVRGYEVPVENLDKTLIALSKQFPPDSGVRLTVDRRTAQVIVAAPESIHRRISQQLGASPKPASAEPAASTQGVIRGYSLKNISWRELEDALATTWGQRMSRTISADGEVAIISAVGENGTKPVLHIDRRENTVAFLGTQESAALWQRAIQTIDRVDGTPEQNTQLVPLSQADPQKVQRAVDLIQAANTGTTQLASTTLPQEENANPDNAGQQPAAEAPPEATAEGRATEGDTTPDEEGDEGGLLGPVQVEYLEGLDVIVLRGHKRDVERVRKIIADIEDVSKVSQPAIEVFPMKNLGCQVMAELVSEIYDEVLSSRQGQVTIRPLVKPNSLLLIGRPESVEIVKTLITKLDQPVAPETQFEVFSLKYISALDAEETIENFFVDGLGESTQGGQTQGLRPGLGTRVNVVAEYRSNALIVQASPSDMEEVRRLLERIDVETTSASNELRIFRLKNALATDIAPVLQDALNWQLIGNRTPVGASQSGIFGGQGFGAGQQEESARIRNAILTFMTIDSDGGKILESGILSDVRVTADTNGNSLLVTGPAKSMGLIEVLVKELDTLPSAKAEIKVFTIVNGDAATLAQMLQQLLAEQAQTTQQGTTLFGQGNLNPFLQPGMQTAASLGESTLVPIRFGVDQRTNSIIATGTEGDLGVVEAILLRLDEERFLEHRTMVYWLANAPAADVAAAVDEWLADREAMYADQLQLTPESPGIQWNRQVIIVPEPISNSVILSATPELFDEVKHVVETLDRKRPLIKIDVLIAEVGLGDIYEFGAEFGLQDGLLFDRTYAAGGGPGYNFNNVPLGDDGPNRDSLLGQVLSDFDIGRISDEGYGGLVLSASKDSISILLRALQEDSRIQILSRPTITTLDSQPATVFVGENTARPGSAIQNATTTQTSVIYEDVGLSLEVLPQVRPDGTIVMDIDTRKSRLDFSRSVTIDGNDIPNIATVNAVTTISARNGQTVVFAGLIETNLQQQVRGIPYLTDIPVLGPLMSYTRDAETRTELLIILTPHLIEEEEQLDAFRYSETERMSWCLADVTALYGSVGLSSRPGNWCPCGGCGTCDICRGNNATPVIFPDMNPTGVIQPIESQPVPAPEPTEVEDPLLPPPVRTSSIRSQPASQVNFPAAVERNRTAYEPGQPAAQYPAVTAGYNGSDVTAGPAPFNQGGTSADAAARRLPPGPR